MGARRVGGWVPARRVWACSARGLRRFGRVRLGGGCRRGFGGAPVGGVPDSGEAGGGGSVVDPFGYGPMPMRPVVAGGCVGGDGSVLGDAGAELAAGLVESVEDRRPSVGPPRPQVSADGFSPAAVRVGELVAGVGGEGVA